jgi:hypothetical protein
LASDYESVSVFSTQSVDSDGNRVVLEIGDKYMELTEESYVVNAIGIALIGLVVLIPWILGCPSFKKGLVREGKVNTYEDGDI